MQVCWGGDKRVRMCVMPLGARRRSRPATTARWRMGAAAASCAPPGRGKGAGGGWPAVTGCGATLCRGPGPGPGPARGPAAPACATPPGRCAAATAGRTPASAAWERRSGEPSSTRPLRSYWSGGVGVIQVSFLSFFLSFTHTYIQYQITHLCFWTWAICCLQTFGQASYVLFLF